MKHYTGIDIIEIPRIAQAKGRWGERFLNRIFTEPELRLCRDKPNVLAVRFAGKEAVMKLLGTGVRGVCWREIEILSHNTGKPFVRLSGGALKVADKLGLNDIAVSLSHSHEYAVASVFSTSNE
ncbi:MAG: holo-ACP synthase [Dehalococcoidales bacterium]|nr:holo-ACP synthase [Dehalococcoidales bacterium]